MRGIEGTVDRFLRGEKTTAGNIMQDIIISMATAGILDNVARRVKTTRVYKAVKERVGKRINKILEPLLDTFKLGSEKETKLLVNNADDMISDGMGAGIKNSIKTIEVTPPYSSYPVKVYTDGNAQINTGKIDIYMRGKIELDVDTVKLRINDLKNIKKNNPELFNENMKNELKSITNKLHNYQRSQEMSKTLNNAGILDNTKNNNMIAEELLEAAKSAKIGNTEIIGYIEGTTGNIQVVSRWKILEDGTPYLATVILKPIK